jgi:hypothetical protein
MIRKFRQGRARLSGPRRRLRQARDNTNSKIVTNRIAQPEPVATDLVTMRRFELIVSTTTAAPFSVSPKQLVDELPGTSTVWDKVQFHKFDIFSDCVLDTDDPMRTLEEYSPLAVTLHSIEGQSGDVPTGYSDSVGTTRRAHVGIIPNHLYRTTWYDSSSEDALLTINCVGKTYQTGVAGQAIVQFVAVLRSSAGTLHGQRADVRRRYQPTPFKFCDIAGSSPVPTDPLNEAPVMQGAVDGSTCPEEMCSTTKTCLGSSIPSVVPSRSVCSARPRVVPHIRQKRM